LLFLCGVVGVLEGLLDDGLALNEGVAEFSKHAYSFMVSVVGTRLHSVHPVSMLKVI
jgi:hypothetical protein